MKGLNLFFLLWKTTLNLKDATNIIKVKKVELIINREKAVATRGKMMKTNLITLNLITGYLPGFLKPHTVTELWKIVANTEGQGDRDGGYGLGWEVIAEKQEFGCCSHQSECVFHDGKILSKP